VRRIILAIIIAVFAVIQFKISCRGF